MLAAIWRDHAQTRASLTARMELTQQSVHRLLTTLNDDGIILFGPLAPPRHKGKPSPRLLLNPRFGCSFGVSVDTDRIGIACMDFAGGYVSRGFAISGDPVCAVLDRLDEEFTALLDQTRFSRADVLGIGFAISGFLMENGRYNPPAPLAHWSGVDLAKTVSDRFGLPCWSENTGNAAVLCEAMFGSGREFQDFAYLNFSYGLGAGFIASGEVVHGAFGNAGEISRLLTPEEQPLRPALGRLMAHLNAAGHELRRIEDIGQALDDHPAEIEQWVEMTAPQFNRIVNAIIAISDPACIVLGGYIPRRLGQMFIDRTEYFTGPRHGYLPPRPQIRTSLIGGESSSIGAACLPLRELAF